MRTLKKPTVIIKEDNNRLLLRSSIAMRQSLLSCLLLTLFLAPCCWASGCRPSPTSSPSPSPSSSFAVTQCLVGFRVDGRPFCHSSRCEMKCLADLSVSSWKDTSLVDAFDSALAITKSNGSYAAIFSAELNTGARKPRLTLSLSLSLFFISSVVLCSLVFSSWFCFQEFIPLDCAADPSLFPFPNPTPGSLLDEVLSRGVIRSAFTVPSVDRASQTFSPFLFHLSSIHWTFLI